MARLVTIEDPDDDRIADYQHLTDADLRRRGDTFLCEGVLAIRKAIETGTALQSLLATPERLEVVAADVDPLGVTVYVVDQSVMNAVTGFNIHRGLVAAATRPSPPPLDELLASTSTIAVVEGVNDHENLGALFRNAAAFGVGAVLLDPHTSDPLYRRSVRVSLGHVLAVPHRRLDRWPGDLDRVRDAGFELVALTPDAEADDVTSLTGMAKVALLLGAEGPGLTREALAAVDRHVRIPIAGNVDSLNVATAAAIAFYHRFVPA